MTRIQPLSIHLRTLHLAAVNVKIRHPPFFLRAWRIGFSCGVLLSYIFASWLLLLLSVGSIYDNPVLSLLRLQAPD